MATAAGESPRYNGWTDRDNSPRRQRLDAQRQMIDLEQKLNDLRMHNVQAEQLHAHQRRVQIEEADLKESTLAKVHRDALDKARRDRDFLRQQAEEALKQHLREEEEKRRRRDEEERQRIQREAEIKAAQEKARREEEERQRLEQEKLRAEAEAKAQAERQRQEELKAEKERLEKEKRDREQQAQEQQDRENAARAQAAKDAEEASQARPEPTPAADPPTANAAADKSAETLHIEYVTLHKKIKTWMNGYWAELREASRPADQKHIKAMVSAARALIRTEVGKLAYGEKRGNKVAGDKLQECLNQLLASPTAVIGKQMPVNFFLPPSLSLNDNDQTTITDQGVYFMCVFSKQVVQSLHTGVTRDNAHAAEPIGTMVTKIFGNEGLQFKRNGTNLPASQQTQSLFPILLAKYHHVCPGLFGITAPYNTNEGKSKLGWFRVEGPDGNKSRLGDETVHYRRMEAFAIGYAAIALRNASTVSKITNPYPPKYFWRSLAQIVNLAPEQVTPVHLCILSNMFGHDGVKRFLLFYGDIGIALLREAYVEFPKRLPQSMHINFHYQQIMLVALRLVANEHLHLT